MGLFTSAFFAPGGSGTTFGAELPPQPSKVTTPRERTSDKQRNDRFIISFLKHATKKIQKPKAAAKNAAARVDHLTKPN
jgi:hypothetical protein